MDQSLIHQNNKENRTKLPRAIGSHKPAARPTREAATDAATPLHTDTVSCTVPTPTRRAIPMTAAGMDPVRESAARRRRCDCDRPVGPAVWTGGSGARGPGRAARPPRCGLQRIDEPRLTRAAVDGWRREAGGFWFGLICREPAAAATWTCKWRCLSGHCYAGSLGCDLASWLDRSHEKSVPPFAVLGFGWIQSVFSS